MSNCTDKNNNPCGCGDGSLSTPPPCNESGDCSSGTECSEMFCTSCIIHCGHSMGVPYAPAGLDNDLIIRKSDSMVDVLESLLLAIKDPTCLGNAPTKFEVLDLTSWNYGGTQMIKRKSKEIINLC